MKELTPQAVLDALRTVVHPETEKDVVSSGLVQDLNLDDGTISFSLVFKKSKNPFANSLKKSCEAAILEKLGADREIIINIGAMEVVHREKSLPDVKNIVAVASGKGGVGKSTVAVNLAVALALEGYAVGLIDADVYGPSIPKMFGLEGYRPEIRKIDGKDRIIPAEKYGVKLISIGFFVDEKDALVWRGPMATNALKQLIQDGNWGELDYLLVDLPPGTGDIHLTLVQTLAVTGVVIVSTPQPVALADAVKGISMFTGRNIQVPVLGLVENMSWFTPAELPENRYYIFGREGCKKLAEEMNVPLLGQIPLVQGIREGGDDGAPVATKPNSPAGAAFVQLAMETVRQTEIRNASQKPTEIVKITH
ncbi:MAG: Mrp/NBP35 family ATP-binding protein [Bacteroidales bacterium]